MKSLFGYVLMKSKNVEEIEYTIEESKQKIKSLEIVNEFLRDYYDIMIDVTYACNTVIGRKDEDMPFSEITDLPGDIKKHIAELNRKLEEERRVNENIISAINSSLSTQIAYAGEFFETIRHNTDVGDEEEIKIPISWNTIKKILHKIRQYAGV